MVSKQKQIITFVSSNKFKIETIQKTIGNRLDGYVEFEYQGIKDLPEIQGNCEEVAIDKALRAYEVLKKPCMVDDESYLIDGLNGFPGPYLKDFEFALKAKGLYDVISKLEVTTSSPQVHYALTYDGKEVHLFQGSMSCKLIKPRENSGHEADYYENLLDPKTGKRLSEMSIDDCNHEMNLRNIALDKFIEFIKNR